MSSSFPVRRCREREDRSCRTAEILHRLAETDPDEREALWDALVILNMPVAQSVAARYRRRGIPDEDLEQVACLALVRAARRFDPARGHDFLSYAVPCIRGEIRRYFRDQGWMVRPPRAIQEMQGRISATESQLASRLGHPATPVELAAEFDAPVAEVESALSANGCFIPTSLDQVPDGEKSPIGEQFGAHDPGMEAAEARVVLSSVMGRLTAREREILDMRYTGGRTQQEIGDAIGVTQMQVSRLLKELLVRLRAELGAGAFAS